MSVPWGSNRLRLRLASAVAVSTPFTEIALVGSLASKLGVLRPLHFDTTPSLETIRNPFRVRPIQLWLTESAASLAPLMIYPCVVHPPVIHAYCDGHFLA